MDPFQLFFAHSFAAEPHESGVSDMDLANSIVDWVHEFSRNRIEVIRTRDPLQNYISSAVRRDICRADAVLCLFTRRVKDHLTNLWLPSTYVISEAAAALMQFLTEEETHRRLFGLVEEGVDASQLGMAFHGNKVAPRFRRQELHFLKSQIKEIVEQILDDSNRTPKREAYEYRTIDKTVSIWRSGAVWVETRHRFRFTGDIKTVAIPHKMWRISDDLPEMEDLLPGSRNSEVGFLRVMPLQCGRHDPDRCHCRIIPGERTRWGYERNFTVEFENVDVRPGDDLQYEIVWGYPRAFHSHDFTAGPDERPNCVGLRTSGRGMVGSASLTLKFERDWEGEPTRILESPPMLYTTEATELPGAQNPEEFFHFSPSWKFHSNLRPCGKRSCNMFEVYSWTSLNFRGMAKVIWTPYPNYFDIAPSRNHAGHTLPDPKEAPLPLGGEGI